MLTKAAALEAEQMLKALLTEIVEGCLLAGEPRARALVRRLEGSLIALEASRQAEKRLT